MTFQVRCKSSQGKFKTISGEVHTSQHHPSKSGHAIGLFILPTYSELLHFILLEVSDASPGNMSSSSKKFDGSSDLSSISPNLIRPFDVTNDRWISPNLIEPFEGDGVKNMTFTKVGFVLELCVALTRLGGSI